MLWARDDCLCILSYHVFINKPLPTNCFATTISAFSLSLSIYLSNFHFNVPICMLNIQYNTILMLNSIEYQIAIYIAFNSYHQNTHSANLAIVHHKLYNCSNDFKWIFQQAIISVVSMSNETDRSHPFSYMPIFIYHFHSQIKLHFIDILLQNNCFDPTKLILLWQFVFEHLLEFNSFFGWNFVFLSKKFKLFMKGQHSSFPYMKPSMYKKSIFSNIKYISFEKYSMFFIDFNQVKFWNCHTIIFSVLCYHIDKCAILMK